MDIIRQGFPVIEVLIGVNDMIRLHTPVDIVIGAVFHECDPDCTGKLETGPPCGRQIPDNTSAAAGNLAKQGDASVFLEGPGHQVPAGEGRGRDEAVQVQAPARQRIVFIKFSVQIYIRPVDCGGLGSGNVL